MPPRPKKPAKTKAPAKPAPAAKKPAKKPAADHPNPFAPAHWPFQKGQTVYYIESRMKWGGGGLATGTVIHYNPALEGNCLITKGRPVVTIKPGDGGIGNVATVGVEEVAPHTPDGKAALEGEIRSRLLAAAAAYDGHARDARRIAALYPAPPELKPLKKKAKRP